MECSSRAHVESFTSRTRTPNLTFAKGRTPVTHLLANQSAGFRILMKSVQSKLHSVFTSAPRKSCTTSHTKPGKSARLTQLDAQDLCWIRCACVIDQDLGKALQRNCLSDAMLGERNLYRDPLSHGTLTWLHHWTITAGHADGSIRSTSVLHPAHIHRKSKDRPS